MVEAFGNDKYKMIPFALSTADLADAAASVSYYNNNLNRRRMIHNKFYKTLWYISSPP